MSDVPPTSPAPVLVRVNRAGPLEPPCRLAGLDILALIGSGGMGAVYKARDPELDCFRAVKVLSPRLAGDAQYVARFRQEARLAAKLDTPCAVRVLRAGEENGLQYLVMEYAGGSTLQARCAHKPLNPNEALHLAASVAEALREAHRLGVIHRDIKPANIIYTSDGSPKLADFGIARPMSAGATGLTVDGATIGTPEYMPPEQAQGSRDLDGRADLYSLGATLYWAVTGRPPFVGDRPSQVIELVINAPLVPPAAVNPAVPGPLSDLIVHLMAKRKEDRPGSAEDLLREISRIREQGGLAPWPRRQGWSAWLQVAAGLLVLAALAAAVEAARRHFMPTPPPKPEATQPIAAKQPPSPPPTPLASPPAAETTKPPAGAAQPERREESTP
nr:serine/threonine-protein kinase [Candidatus Brocadiia bacterium]